MADYPTTFLEQVDECPELFHNLEIMGDILRKQKADSAAVPEEIAANEKLYAEGVRAFQSFFRRIGKISDPDVSLLLTARALLGMPWELLRARSGGDAREACAAWLDKHAGEV